MVIRISESVVRQIFETQPARLARILSHKEDLFHALATSSGRALSRAENILGRNTFRRLRDRVANERFRVSIPDARAVREFYARAEFLGDDSDIVRLIEEAGLGRLLESDHLIEQRFIDELAWGNASFFRRSEVRSLGRDAERIDDITAIATPKNEIIYYRLARRSPNTGFELAGLYPHTGPGSKTTRMAQFIPVGSEGAHSLLDIANAHRWVLINEQGFPAIYEHHFLEDLAHALIVGMERNPQLRRQATRIIGNNLDTRNIVRYLRSTGRPTMETFSPQNWPRYKEIEMPTIL